VATEDQVADPVEGAAPDTVDVLRTRERFDAAKHLASGPVGECGEEDPLRRNALLDQIGDAVGDRTRFARAGSRNDQGGLGRGGNDAKLLVVQFRLVSG
jgi:hypothetical protein